MNLSAFALPSLKAFASFKLSPRRVILSFTGTTVLGSLLYPQTQSRFELFCQETEENKRRIERCPNINSGVFYPTPYLPNGTLQALWASSATDSDPNLQFKEETLELPCGGKVGLHWASHVEYRPVDRKKVVVVVLPGLTASAEEPYVRNITSEALDNGYEVVVYHKRGILNEMTLPTNGFLNPLEDFDYALEQVKARYPEHTIFAVGHSFGANTLVNYLGRYHGKHSIKAAASIANPFDFVKAATGILNTMFDNYLAESMQGWAKKNQEALMKAPEHFNIEFDKAMKVKSMVEFDEFITRRITGYSNFLDYYSGISSSKVLDNVNVPLLCMNAKDDPILHHSSIPIEESMKNKNITMLVTNHGGHVGWFQGLVKPKRWYPKPTVEFLNACHDEMKN